MKMEEFNYELPEALIAQTPLLDRTASKLLVMDRATGAVTHEPFIKVLDHLEPGDCLVLNDTRVLPARLFGLKADTGAKIELLLLEDEGQDTWKTLTKPARKVKVGTKVTFGEGLLEAVCTAEMPDGIRKYRLVYKGILYEVLDELGEMPLPPYIKEVLSENERYQTVYAKEQGSAAAPTAGLHFTKDLLAKIEAKGVKIAYVTLHVGLGTFRPVSVEDPEDHTMHEEFYILDETNAKLLNDIKAAGKRIIAVGTTSTRVLETIANSYDGKFTEKSGWTNIFIYPPYTFRAIDGLLTNFHLPKSTLVMLVSAFSTRNHVIDAYQTAVEKQYRFFSFGDAMLII